MINFQLIPGFPDYDCSISENPPGSNIHGFTVFVKCNSLLEELTARVKII